MTGRFAAVDVAAGWTESTYAGAGWSGIRAGDWDYRLGYAAGMAARPWRRRTRRRHWRAPACICDPRHLDAGGYDAGCPRHDATAAGESR